MKNLFWILLLANVILFAVMQRGGFNWGEQAVHPQPELNSDMIRLLPEPKSSPAKPSSGAPAHARTPTPVPSPPAPANETVTVDAPPPPVPTPSPSPLALNMAVSGGTTPSKSICLEWGDFSGSDLARAKAALSALQLADKLGQRQIEQDIGYWVYIPPLRDKAAVKRKIGELKALGITEYFVVQGSGHWMNAISLGVFKTQKAAENFLHTLNTKGVRTARVGERASKLITTVFVLNKVDAETEIKLKAMQMDFAGSELNSVPCGLTR
jgi:SPOR domain